MKKGVDAQHEAGHDDREFCVQRQWRPTMIRTPVCELLGIEHPIALGGMGSAFAPQLVAAVSNAGGLGAMGCHYLTPEQISAGATDIRKATNKPFALNFLLFDVREDSFA